MKKKLVSALALMMSCVMLAACGGNKVEENTTTPQTETSEAVTESTEEAASTETEAAGELTDVTQGPRIAKLPVGQKMSNMSTVTK